ncbi:MAG: DNA-binding protein [Pontibacterium sp.]
MRKETTQEKVHRAADALLIEGKRPTQQNIRDYIGSGSISTINKALNEWWANLGLRIQANEQRPDLPGPVIDTAKAVWDQALLYAQETLDEKFQKAKAEIDEEWHAINEAKKDTSHQSTAFLNAFDKEVARREASEAELKEAQAALMECEKQVIRLTTENTALSRELKQLDLLASQPKQNAPDELIELTIQLRVREKELVAISESRDTLAQKNEQLLTELAELKKQRTEREHALETVIAQQDVRYQALNDEYRRYREGDFR